MDTSPTIRLTIAPEHDGQPLRELVIAALAGELDGELLMARGGLWVDGKRMRDMDARARAGAEVAIHRPLAGVYPDIYACADQIIYEDEDLLALNKPAGVYVDSTPWDAEGNYHAALVRFITARDGAAPTLHLAHRLDRDTTGVLLLTNDGPLAHRLAHPRYGVEKTYVAEVQGEPGGDVLQRLAEGIDLDDGPTAPARVTLLTPSRLELVLHEGRNRQVRRMLEAVGHPVVKLRRSRYAGLGPGRLRPGDWRDLTRDEVRRLRRLVGL